MLPEFLGMIILAPALAAFSLTMAMSRKYRRRDW